MYSRNRRWRWSVNGSAVTELTVPILAPALHGTVLDGCAGVGGASGNTGHIAEIRNRDRATAVSGTAVAEFAAAVQAPALYSALLRTAQLCPSPVAIRTHWIGMRRYWYAAVVVPLPSSP